MEGFMKERIYQDGELNFDDRDSKDYSNMIDRVEEAKVRAAQSTGTSRLAREYEPEEEDNYDISQDL